LLGEIAGRKSLLKDAGRTVESWWKRLPGKFPGVILEEFVIMPNHLHALLGLTRLPEAGRPGNPSAPLRTVQPPTLARAIQWFKTMSTNAYYKGVRQHGWPAVPERLWQRDYYEHIVRTGRAAQRIAAYILENPQRWALDVENSRAARREPDSILKIIETDR